MSKQQQNDFVKGALFLTIAGFLGKILSASYRIPLQNLTGDHGFYIYQQVYPFLGMMIILSLYGFPSAIAKIIADEERKGHAISFRTVYFPVFFLLLLGFSVIAIIFFRYTTEIATFIGDPKLVKSFRWLALAILFIPVTSLLRGIFQGHQQMHAIAYSQISEQLVRVVIIITAAIFTFYGYLHIYDIGVFGVIASIGGALAAIINLLIFLKNTPLTQAGTNEYSWRSYGKTLLLFGVVASLNHMILLLIQFADVFTLVPQLIKNGLASIEAMELKGVFDRGMPLIQLGTVIGSSFGLALVPTVARGDEEASHEAVETALKISFFVSVGAALGLILIFKETNILLYKNALGTTSLQVLSLSISFSALSITTLSILQSLGYFKRTALFMLCSFGLKWVGNVLLVPIYGIMGSALATVGSLLFLFVVSVLQLRRVMPLLRVMTSRRFRALVVAVLSMASFIVVMKWAFSFVDISSRLGLLGYVLSLVVGGAGTFMFVLIRLRVFSRNELAAFPLSKVLLWVYEGRDDR